MLEADFAFHKLIAELTENPYLISYTDQLLDYIHRYKLKYYQNYTDYALSAEEHFEIIEAIKKGDSNRADLFMKKNWLEACNKIKMILGCSFTLKQSKKTHAPHIQAIGCMCLLLFS